jgi:peptide/nickel transport system permease protein
MSIISDPLAALPVTEAAAGLAEPRRGVFRAFFRRPGAVVSLIVLAVIALAAIFASVLAPDSPNVQDFGAQMAPPAWAGGTWSHILGTDELGRDTLSRLMYGARDVLALSFLAATVTAVIGTLLGVLAGMIERGAGWIVNWLCDAQLAFPFIVLALVVITVRGDSFGTLLFVLSIFGWVQYARVVRAEVLRLKRTDYVLAARGGGGSTMTIIRQHILPNVTSQVLVLWTFSIAQVLLLESSLSFLGLGVQPPTADWGQMFANGRAYLLEDWWYCFFPGLAITLTILCAYVIGRALRDVLNPRLR